MMEGRRNSKRNSAHTQSRRESRMSRKSVVDASIQQKKNVPLHKCTFDRKFRCWVGPTTTDNQTSNWAKAKGAVLFLGLRVQQAKRTIDVESLVKATLRKRNTYFGCVEEGEMDVSVDDNQQFVVSTLGEKPVIKKPFHPSRDNKNQSVWIAPRPLKQTKERSLTFSFERPKPVDQDKLASSVSSHQAVFLKKTLQDKEVEIQMLRNQLMKANTENVKLINELEGYRGKNYDETYNENLTLKDNLTRVIRENIMLRGRIRQDGNSKLQNSPNRGRSAPINSLKRE